MKRASLNETGSLLICEKLNSSVEVAELDCIH